jgi:hypothetical protein
MKFLLQRFSIKNKFLFRNTSSASPPEDSIQINEKNFTQWTKNQLRDLKDVIGDGITKDEVIFILKDFQDSVFKKGKNASPRKSAKAILGIQTGLKHLGFFDNKVIDGVYGTRDTKPAILKFQKKWNNDHPEDSITEDGIPGKQTITRLIQSLENSKNVVKSDLKKLSGKVNNSAGLVTILKTKEKVVPSVLDDEGEVEINFSFIEITYSCKVKEFSDGTILDQDGNGLENKGGFFKFRGKEVYVKKINNKWEKCTKEGETIDEFWFNLVKKYPFFYAISTKDYQVSIENGELKIVMEIYINGGGKVKISKRSFIETRLISRLQDLEGAKNEKSRQEAFFLSNELLKLTSKEEKIVIKNNIVLTVAEMHKKSDSKPVAFSVVEGFLNDLKAVKENNSINDTLWNFYFEKFKETKDSKDKEEVIKYFTKERKQRLLDLEATKEDPELKRNRRALLVGKFNKILKEMKQIERKEKRKRRMNTSFSERQNQ